MVAKANSIQRFKAGHDEFFSSQLKVKQVEQRAGAQLPQTQMGNYLYTQIWKEDHLNYVPLSMTSSVKIFDKAIRKKKSVFYIWKEKTCYQIQAYLLNTALALERFPNMALVNYIHANSLVLAML